MGSIENPALPAGALVLVTGANGFIGSHTVNQLLLAGYRVRGTVRDTEKHSWVQSHFDELHGKGKFELVEVKDLTSESALGEALKDVAGVIHTASDVNFDPDPNKVVTPVINMTLRILKAAAKVPTIKRVVYTSSSMAAASPNPNVEFVIDENSWNDAAVEAAWAPPPYEQSRGYLVYGASKVQAEKALWKFMEEEKPGFVLNTVLPDSAFGPPLDPKNQGHPTASGFVAALFNCKQEDFGNLIDFLAPQWFIDVHDAARLHVIALVNPQVNSERVFGFAEPFNFNDILAILRKNFPNKEFLDDWPDLPRDLSTIAKRDRSIELLQEFGRPGFVSLEESIVGNVEDLV